MPGGGWSWGQARPLTPGVAPPRGRGEASARGAELARSPNPRWLRPRLKAAELRAPLTRLSRWPPSSAMASALSYVSKFKSFVILFITPLLLLPLVILMPAKVSRSSADPARPMPAAPRPRRAEVER